MYLLLKLNASHIFRQTLQKKSARMKPPAFYHSTYDSDDENTDEEESENEKSVEKSVKDGECV